MVQIIWYCNPMMEEVYNVPENFVNIVNEVLSITNNNTLDQKASNVLENEELQIVNALKAFGSLAEESRPGGSGSNIAAGMSSLGIKTGFFGGIGKDYAGLNIEKEMRDEYGIFPCLFKNNEPTARVLSIVPPDGNRLFAVGLGAAESVKPSDLPFHKIYNAEYIGITGYKYTDKSWPTTSLLVKFAKKYNKKIILDLSCPRHTYNFKERLKNTLNKGVYSILANEEESEVWWGIPPGSSIEEYFEIMEGYREYADIVVQKLGKRGVMVSYGDNTKFFPTEVVEKPELINDNGAGDGFAAGFYSALLLEYDEETSARFGLHCSREVVQQVSPRMPYSLEALIQISK